MGRKRNSTTRNSVEQEIQELVGPSFLDLPYDMTNTILVRLPIKSVLICRCVCKTWNMLISDPYFAKLHFNTTPFGVIIRTNSSNRVSRTLHFLHNDHTQKLHTFDHPFCFCEANALNPDCNSHLKLDTKFKLPLRDANLDLVERGKAKNGRRKKTYIACSPSDDKFGVVNSCKGLICLCDPKEGDPLAVCNPVTGEFIRLPKTSSIRYMVRPVCAGFGFHPKTNEYKVIRMFFKYSDFLLHTGEWMFTRVVVELHTLGTSTWKNIGEFALTSVSQFIYPTCVNGGLHWIGFNRRQCSIFCFNFDSERLLRLPPPPKILDENRRMAGKCISIGELKGFLYVCNVSSIGDVGMWVMMNYGIGQSWSKLLAIDNIDVDRWPSDLYWPVQFFNGALLLYHSCNCLIFYESKKLKGFQIRGFKYDFEVFPHIPSLISLKDAVKGDNVEVLNVYSRCSKYKLREENDVLFLALEDVEMLNS